MKVYVAGKWTDKDRIHGYMEQLKSMGMQITHDWTVFESNSNNSKADMAEHDINGVINADWVVFIMDDPSYPYRGSFTELGAALALHKKVFILGPMTGDYSGNVFFHHPEILHMPDWTTFTEFIRFQLFNVA